MDRSTLVVVAAVVVDLRRNLGGPTLACSGVNGLIPLVVGAVTTKGAVLASVGVGPILVVGAATIKGAVLEAVDAENSSSGETREDGDDS